MLGWRHGQGTRHDGPRAPAEPSRGLDGGIERYMEMLESAFAAESVTCLRQRRSAWTCRTREAAGRQDETKTAD